LERAWTKAGVATAATAGLASAGPMSAATTIRTQTALHSRPR
jgi:hypothetical protein